MALDGKGAEEIMARLEEMKLSVRAYFMADDLSHLQRGGRLKQCPSLDREFASSKAGSPFC